MAGDNRRSWPCTSSSRCPGAKSIHQRPPIGGATPIQSDEDRGAASMCDARGKCPQILMRYGVRSLELQVKNNQLRCRQIGSSFGDCGGRPDL